MENRTHYQRLEVSTSASTEQIKAAYRRLARQHHPDLNNGTDAEIMKQLNEAYAVLTEIKRRESYDQTLEDIPRPYHVPKNQIKPRGSREDEAQVLWLQRIYHPVSRSISRIVDSSISRIIKDYETIGLSNYETIFSKLFWDLVIGAWNLIS